MTIRSVLATIAVVVGAAHAAAASPVSTPAQAPAADRVLVMPFDNPSGEGRIHWLREAATVVLADDLRAIGLKPIGREERLKAFDRLGVPVGASLSDATIIRLGELLGASSVVVGSLGLDNDKLTIRARTIRLDSGRMQPEVVSEAPLPDLFRSFSGMVPQLFPFLTIEAKPAAGDKDHPPLAAFESYVKGLIAETPTGQEKFLLAALKDYPDYDAARLALWQTYNLEGEHPKALAVALQVPDKSAFARRARFLAALSQLQLKQYDAAFNNLRALGASQAAATISNNMGVVQLRRGAFPSGGAASSFFTEARKLDDDDADYAFNLGYAFYVERDLQATIYWLRECVRMNPADGEAHYLLGTALTATGAASEGAREKDLARRLSSRYADWDRRPAGDPVPRGLERIKEDLQPSPLARGDLAFQTAGQKDQQDLVRFHLEQGKRLFEHETDREATAELKRAIYLSPYEPEAHLLLGRIYLRANRVREAIDELKISLWSQETVAVHLALGEAYLQDKDTASARAEAQRALVLDPQSVDAKKLLERIGQAPGLASSAKPGTKGL